ncbi:DapH/DapD/GlmU-related protein [Synechococcus sp. PCC 7336]|uniref:DapH/DapD/GlmU-related protein n=1 Tax=Synechococcus sp. PCC 7336 TaxID=195250 RepID=UPI0012EA3281|nr:DapH/DapD/GlmU-related protein [Synechococcus sp. PCC 7336]
MDATQFQTHASKHSLNSPWPLHHRLRVLLWATCWTLLCSWTPKPLNRWRVWVLKRFGCKVMGSVFVHQRARIQIPWHVTLHDRACIGDRANLYSLGEIELGERTVVAQECYLCTGTHDFSIRSYPLMTAKIAIGKDVFLGARTFVLPGLTVGDGALVGACSVVTKDLPSWQVCAGNPCKPVKPRQFEGVLEAIDC